MIKSLLLATSCVIGSGGGALLKNAPRFSIINNNTNQWANSEIENQTPNQNIYNYQIDNWYIQRYNGYKQEDTNNHGYYKIENYFLSKCPYYINYQEAEEASEIFYESFMVTKITPYMNFDIATFTISLETPIEPATGLYNITEYTQDQYITNNNKCEQMIEGLNNWNNYVSYDPLAIFTINELNQMRKGYVSFYLNEEDESPESATQVSQDWEFITHNINDLNGTWLELESYNQSQWTISNSKQPIYIINTAFLEISQFPDNENKAPMVYNGQLSFTSEISLKFTTAINPTDPSNYEVIDLSKLLFDIVTLPFTFVSRAFNLTLFPGTAFEFNISTLFLGIFALLIFIYIIRLVIKFFI